MTSRRAFLASLAALVSAPVVGAFAPATPIVLGPAFTVPFNLSGPQGLVFHKDAFALTMAPLDAEPFSILDVHQRYIAPAAKAMADEIGADIMKRFTRSR